MTTSRENNYLLISDGHQTPRNENEWYKQLPILPGNLDKGSILGASDFKGLKGLPRKTRGQGKSDGGGRRPETTMAAAYVGQGYPERGPRTETTRTADSKGSPQGTRLAGSPRPPLRDGTTQGPGQTSSQYRTELEN